MEGLRILMLAAALSGAAAFPPPGTGGDGDPAAPEIRLVIRGEGNRPNTAEEFEERFRDFKIDEDEADPRERFEDFHKEDAQDH